MRPSGNIKDLIREYRLKKGSIKARLKDFKNLHKGPDEDIFQELCFCLLTPQSKAVLCDRAIKELKKAHLLLTGNEEKIRPKLKGNARFHNKKASFIVGARNMFKDGKHLRIKNRLEIDNAYGTRDWLVENIKGLGYKEATHFLRNIGLGSGLAILDRHILKNLEKYGVINKIPPSVSSKKVYMEIEDKIGKFCKKIKIPAEELDLLLWSIETGFIFK